MQLLVNFWLPPLLALTVATPFPRRRSQADPGPAHRPRKRCRRRLYTVEPDGFLVVATFAQRGESGAPVRFQTILAPGQSVIFPPRAGWGSRRMKWRSFASKPLFWCTRRRRRFFVRGQRLRPLATVWAEPGSQPTRLRLCKASGCDGHAILLPISGIPFVSTGSRGLFLNGMTVFQSPLRRNRPATALAQRRQFIYHAASSSFVADENSMPNGPARCCVMLRPTV